MSKKDKDELLFSVGEGIGQAIAVFLVGLFGLAYIWVIIWVLNFFGLLEFLK